MMINTENMKAAVGQDEVPGVRHRVIRILSEVSKAQNIKRIDTEILKLVHREDSQSDGFIGFATEISGKFHDICGAKITEIDKHIDDLRYHLEVDGKFTVNASFAAKPRKSPISLKHLPIKKEEHLRYLNACYLDIDCYFHRNDLGFSDALKVVLEAEHQGYIPPVSIICFSGRGMYLLWLLKQESDDCPEKAFAEQIKAYKKVNKKLARMLDGYQKLGIDYAAHDAARMLRVPGSVNSKSGHTVVFCPQQDEQGNVPEYTLKELYGWNSEKPEKHHNVTAPDCSPQAPANRRNKSVKRKQPKKINGYRQVGKNLIHDLTVIEKISGGFLKGNRGKTLFILAYSARKSGYSKVMTTVLLEDVAANCKPPYPSDASDNSVKDIVSEVWESGMVHYRNDYLAEKYSVTEDVAKNYSLRSIGAKKETGPRKQKQLQRRDAIRMLPDYYTITLRMIRKELLNQGIKASLATISKDRDEMTAAGDY